MFQDRSLVIATQHGKEAVIAPALENALGVRCFVPEQLDTDILGTFTGEVERKDDPIATLRSKCRLAMAQTGCDLAVASEGSFGPHPTLFFPLSGDELVMLLDEKAGLEIIGRDLTTETNFSGSEVESLRELETFAKRAGFPEHALILRNEKGGNARILKGIKAPETLRKSFEEMLRDFGHAYVETDMRAMNNPTRMKSIGRAVENLLEKTKSLCPQCSAPGFSVVEAKKGLPCAWCGMPTESTLAYVYGCTACSFQKEEKYPHGKEKEEPMYCGLCNP